jgi:hypothetical protein
MRDKIIEKTRELIELLEESGHNTEGDIFKKHITIVIVNDRIEVKNNNFKIRETTEIEKAKETLTRILAIDDKTEFRRQLRNLCYKIETSKAWEEKA